uniref:Ig-like domain-containing protein n=1 Tax=Oryzias latipes TaxID=8090 RepID=A0A3B3H8T1_ORYLA
MGSLVALCVLTVVLGFVKTELQNKEFALGGTLTLKPAALTSSISSITWKHNDNLLAEQLTSDSKPDYYPQNEDRISLNFKTGELSIIKLTEKDAGRYNVEINNVIQNVGYQVKIIKRVPVPTVVVQPLACSETTPNCTVDCQGDVTGAGTVRYFWKEDDGGWKESAKKKEIKNDADTQKIKEFFCKVNNSVSEDKSPATKNPFYKEPSSSVGKVAGILPVLLHSDASICRQLHPCSSLFSISELESGCKLYGWMAPILLTISVRPNVCKHRWRELGQGCFVPATPPTTHT